MGHAGAIISGGKGDAKSKIAALEAVGIRVVRNPSKMGEAMAELMGVGKASTSAHILSLIHI